MLLIFDKLHTRCPKVQVNLLGILSQQISFSVVPMNNSNEEIAGGIGFDLRDFSNQVRQVTKELTVCSATVSLNNLDRVFSRLVMSNRYSSTRLNSMLLQASQKNHKQRVSINDA